MADLLDIDGSILEGGGQILRISIALSAILGVPVRVSKIRAARSKPGLAAQHLKGVQLVADMCQAKLKGVQIGSTEIEFVPGKIKGGHYLADTKTAGSISLLLQVALPVALMADGPVTIDMKGGTNADLAPQIDYMTEVFQPLLRKFGADFQLDLHRRGYYPRGGGHVTVTVSPIPQLTAVNVTQRGDLTSVTGSSFVAGVLPNKVLPDQLRRLWLNMKTRQRKRLIAERQNRMLAERGACPASLIDGEITNIAETILEDISTPQEDSSFVPKSEAVSLSSESADPLAAMPHNLNISECDPTLRTEEQLKLFIMQEEFKRQEERYNDLHRIELCILQEKLKEATARATIANLELEKIRKEL